MAFGKDSRIDTLEAKVKSVEDRIERAIISMEKTIERMERRDHEYRIESESRISKMLGDLERKTQDYRLQTDRNISMMRWALGLGLSALLAFTLYQNSIKPQQPYQRPQIIIVQPERALYNIEEREPPRLPKTPEKAPYQP